ncbi:MAG: cupredoxin domain-containing protein, partial [Acidimicrobiales bacterium]
MQPIHRTVVAVAVGALVLATAGCGGGDGGEETQTTTPADQTVDVAMVDIAFEPEEVTVKAGTSVRFRFNNEGRIVHDATFGDEAHQQAVETGKAERQGVEVGPNGTRDYVRTFTQPGTLIIGCHQ